MIPGPALDRAVLALCGGLLGPCSVYRMYINESIVEKLRDCSEHQQWKHRHDLRRVQNDAKTQDMFSMSEVEAPARSAPLRVLCMVTSTDCVDARAELMRADFAIVTAWKFKQTNAELFTPVCWIVAFLSRLRASVKSLAQ